jgi:hypothetical protein
VPHVYYQNTDYLPIKHEVNGLYGGHRRITGLLYTSVIWINTRLHRGKWRIHLVSCIQRGLCVWKTKGRKVGLV